TAPPDNDVLTYSWTKDAGCPAQGGFDDASAQNPIFTFGGTGTCILTVVVTDPVPGLTGALPSATANITLSESALAIEYGPSITLGAQSVLTAIGGQTVTLEIAAEDHNSPPQGLTYSWN